MKRTVNEESPSTPQGKEGEILLMPTAQRRNIEDKTII